MRRTKRFASFALAACMGVSLLVNVPAGTVSAAEPTEVVTSPVAGVAEEEVPGATGTDAEALDETQEVVYEADANGFVWDGTRIVDYVGEGGDVKIPEGCTGIGADAFSECSGLTSIEIPSSVTGIGDGAFYGCSGLTSIEIPSSETSIGYYTFARCTGLTSIKIPSSVERIDDFAFLGCSGLTSIEIPSSVTRIGWSAFADCSGLTSIVVSPENPYYSSEGNCNAIICNNVGNDDRLLIRGCENTKIPSNVTYIGDYAFSGCSGLTSIEIPSSVKSIGWYAFRGCSGLTSIEIPSSVTRIDRYAFLGCSGLTSIEIPSSVTDIGWNVFTNCSGLTNIVVSPENPKYNSEGNCNAIIETETKELVQGCKNTKIPTSVTSIGYGAFSGCSDLTSIKIPSSVTSIEEGAFYGCSGLTSIEIPSSVTSIVDGAFDESGLRTIYGTSGSYAESFAKENHYEFIDPAKPVVTPDVTTSYRTHVQKDGWQGFVTNGTMSGTSGQFKRLEGIEIKVEGNKNLGIQYTTHCQTYGWLPWSSNGEMNGTQAEAKRLEAIKIQLTGKDKDKYDVYYRVHAQSYGWLGWAKNGACAGTAGQAKRLEGIQIVVVKHGDPAPGLSYAGVNVTSNANSGKPYVSSIAGDVVIPGDANGTNIMYKTHVQSFGWQNWVLNGTMSGTSGKAKRLEGINIKLSNAQYAGGIEYRTHIQKNGWEQGWKKDGAMSGTSGEAKRLEAIQIRLYGEMAEKYDVYYRVHAQSFGWLGWAKNGEESGTAGLAKRLEGIQIVLVPKGGTAPAANYGNIQSTNAKAYIKK